MKPISANTKVGIQSDDGSSDGPVIVTFLTEPIHPTRLLEIMALMAVIDLLRFRVGEKQAELDRLLAEPSKPLKPPTKPPIKTQ